MLFITKHETDPIFLVKFPAYYLYFEIRNDTNTFSYNLSFENSFNMIAKI